MAIPHGLNRGDYFLESSLPGCSVGAAAVRAEMAVSESMMGAVTPTAPHLLESSFDHHPTAFASATAGAEELPFGSIVNALSEGYRAVQSKTLGDRVCHAALSALWAIKGFLQ